MYLPLAVETEIDSDICVFKGGEIYYTQFMYTKAMYT